MVVWRQAFLWHNRQFSLKKASFFQTGRKLRLLDPFRAKAEILNCWKIQVDAIKKPKLAGTRILSSTWKWLIIATPKTFMNITPLSPLMSRLELALAQQCVQRALAKDVDDEWILGCSCACLVVHDPTSILKVRQQRTYETTGKSKRISKEMHTRSQPIR